MSEEETRGWKCPECGGTGFSVTTYESVRWSVSDGKMELEECEGGTNLVGYSDEWECVDCGWEGRTAPAYVSLEDPRP